MARLFSSALECIQWSVAVHPLCVHSHTGGGTEIARIFLEDSWQDVPHYKMCRCTANNSALHLIEEH